MAQVLSLAKRVASQPDAHPRQHHVMVTHDPRSAERAERQIALFDGKIVDDRRVPDHHGERSETGITKCADGNTVPVRKHRHSRSWQNLNPISCR